MQCPSCGFQNLPGLTACARCTGVLDFSGLCVEPYRSSDHWVRLRHWLWKRRRRNLPPWRRRFLDFWVNQWQRCGLATAVRSPEEPTHRERAKWVVASVVPGVGQVLSGRRRRGLILLGLFCLSLLLSVVFMSWGWWFFTALAVALHAYVVTDAIFYRDPHFRPWQPVVVSFLMILVLQVVLYAPAGWVINGLVRFEIMGDALDSDALRPRDVVMLQGRWLARAPYRPGDVVSYMFAGDSGQGWNIQGGVSIERILAGPGDRVVSRNGQWIVNGRPLPSDQGLLIRAPLPRGYTVLVPPDTYFIYPSLPRFRTHGNANLSEADLRVRISHVPAGQIRGRAIAITNPISRIRLF